MRPVQLGKGTQTVPTRRLKLRYPVACATCATELSRGTEAEWDSDVKVARCLDCVGGSLDETVEPPAQYLAPVVSGPAGGSARAAADRHRAERSAKVDSIKTAHPILGRIALAIDPLPDRGAVWEKGAIGEEKFGGTLDELSCETNGKFLVLHDRRIPRTTANIDHMAVTPTGVWVIDAKRYSGRVDYANRGGWFSNDVRLTVAGRDRTKLVHGVHKQIERVRTSLASTPFDEVTLRGALCFIDSEWGVFAKPFAIEDVLVTWGKKLRERLIADGPLDHDDRAAIHRHLAASFPPAA